MEATRSIDPKRHHTENESMYDFLLFGYISGTNSSDGSGRT